MAFNGNGVFNLDFSWPNDAANGIPITASRVQAEDQNIADGLSMCVTTDGQSTTTGNIPFAAGIGTDTLNPVTANGPVSLSAGQLKFPTASATRSSNVNTLDNYQEGSFTLVDLSGQSIPITNIYTKYTLIGRLCSISATITYGASAVATPAVLNGLPFPAVNTPGVGGAVCVYGLANCFVFVSPGDTFISFVTATGTPITDATLSNQTLRFQLHYEVV